MSNYIKQITEKWEPVLNYEGIAPITDSHKRSVTAMLFENMAQDAAEQQASALMEADIPNVSGDLTGNAGASNLARFDPILISLIRRAAPMMIAFDVAGVQPMTGPTGLIFALRSGYANTTSGFTSEALFNEAQTGYSGDGSTQTSLSGAVPFVNANTVLTTGIGTSTLLGETDSQWPQMGFALEKHQVTAKTRRLKADYTVELAQDLKKVNNLDAEQELANILTTEIVFEQNREIIRTIYNIAKPGGTSNTGSVDLSVSTGDIDGRYFAEQWRGLRFLIEKDAIKIQKDTRRGKGNILIVDAETAAALSMIGVLDYSLIIPKDAALSAQPDETTSTFVGTMGKMKVFVDPYIDLGKSFYLVGYKGTSPYDAGLFYCPYLPLQKFQVTNPYTFQPSVGFKTRYGITESPFAYDYGTSTSQATWTSTGSVSDAHKNKYFRVSIINNLG